MTISPGLPGQRRDQVSHRQDKYRQRQCSGDPETPRHVTQLGTFRVIRSRCRRLWFQRHAALGAIAEMILLHFRVHWACVNGFARWLPFVPGDGGRGQKLLPAVVTAEVKPLSIALNTERHRFVNRHSTNRVFDHINSLSFDWFSGARTASTDRPPIQ